MLLPCTYYSCSLLFHQSRGLARAGYGTAEYSLLIVT